LAAEDEQEEVRAVHVEVHEVFKRGEGLGENFLGFVD
jgi:hypothetical protein